jgi:hypothetical protein
MMQLLLFLTIGFLFLVFLWVFVGRKTPVEGSARTLLEARQALAALQQGLLPAATVERIFSKSDYEYVSALREPHLEALFLTERRLIALLWVKQMREQILCLRQFHLGAARLYAQVSMAKELRLAVEFVSLLIACRLMQFAIYFQGPYAAPRMVSRLATAAATACTASETAVALLKPLQSGVLAQDPARKATAS